MKKKLPSYTFKEALEEVNPCDSYYSLEVVRKMFPGKSKITARDILKVPAKKFRHEDHNFGPGAKKCYAASCLMPPILRRAWEDAVDGGEFVEGSSIDVKLGLKICDMYEKGRLYEL